MQALDDGTCVTGDGDLRFTGSGWAYPQNRVYHRNACRVLLIRARQGMVVFVPRGDKRDPTRLPSFYDSTFSYLRDAGIPALA